MYKIKDTIKSLENGKQPLADITLEILNKIYLGIENNQGDELLKSIKTGRFDKEKFGLLHTVIIGDNGGLYALLNNVNEKELEHLIRITSEEYLNDKKKFD